MHIQKSTLLAIVVAAVLSPNLLAQSSSFTASSLARSTTSSASTVATSGSLDPSTQELIKNRARIFANGEETANRTRYFYVNDESLRSAKTPEEVLQRLTPSAITPGDQTRNMQIVVDLKTPLTVYAARDQTINVGTAIVQQAGSRSIEVQSDISMAGLTIISK